MDPGRDGGDGLTATTLSCTSCGTELPPDSRFCNKCGAPVTQVSRSAEYKQVTVLFADVVHSMDIAAAVGPERLREIVADLADRCAAVVQRYGGTVDKFTGDGIMAVFGAPVALEDHAVRSCMAALGVQEEAKRLAEEVQDRDSVDLRLRVGLNSGQVIVGQIGSGSFGYTAVGEQVGMAQRMESVAPPGGVMLSESTARLVDGAATLGESELVQIKGADAPVPARRLLGMGEGHRPAWRAESNLVGRRWEMAAVEGLLDRAIGSHGAVVGVVGSPGIGKSRLVREVAALARRRGVEVFTTYCESHTSQVPFHAVAQLSRTATGVEGLDGQTARDRVRNRVPDADPEDVRLLDDLLGIADPDVALPKIDPDARRRRLTALVNAMSLGRKSPAVYVIEDAHWIDEVSESLLTEFLMVIPQTPSLVLVAYRPEYEGALARVHGAQTIALAPLSDSETAALVSGLLGPDPSNGALGQKIAERAAGNPFFAEEIVRELAERGVLHGERGGYVSMADVSEVSVPATLQATIAARIDRLDPKAKLMLGAAAVLGSRFGLDLLTGLGVEPAVDDLMAAQLIDQVKFTPQPEYVFHHPLIRTVAYESQLKSDRARLHSRLAAAIEAREPESADQNAVLIAEHLEAAGDLLGAYDWHMRAGAWSTTRDTAAARASWDRAAQISDALSDDHPDRLAMRIAARTLLCGSAWRVHADVSDRFDELSTLCTAAGDKASLAIGMTGLVGEHFAHVRIPEASRLASEQMTLIQSIGDPLLTIALAPVLCVVKHEAADFGDVLRWSQAVIDLADGDPTKGDMFIGSPLCWALAQRGQARWALNQPGWQDDFDRSIAMASRTDAVAYAYVVNAIYTPAVSCGVLVPDDSALYLIEEALRIAERTADDVALGMARTTLGIALVFRDSVVERERGLELLEQLRDMCLHERYFLSLLQFGAVYIARERSRHGDQDGALALMREAVDGMHHTGHLGPFAPCTGVLVETLLARGSERDIAEAAAAIDRLVAAPVNGFVVRDIILLRLRALMSSACGDNATYRDFRHRYREMATSLGFEGHIAWAEAMP